MSDLGYRIARTYPTAPERVWAHFTQPELMAQWFCPNPALEVTCDLDVRPGGRWRCAMGPYVVGGELVEVEPRSRLAFTWDWEHESEAPTTVTVTLTPEGDGTRLVLEHAETAPDVGDDGTRGGWTITLGRLGDALD